MCSVDASRSDSFRLIGWHSQKGALFLVLEASDGLHFSWMHPEEGSSRNMYAYLQLKIRLAAHDWHSNLLVHGRISTPFFVSGRFT